MPANRGSYRPGDLKAILGAGAILGGVYQFFSVLSIEIPKGNYGPPMIKVVVAIIVIVLVAAVIIIIIINIIIIIITTITTTTIIIINMYHFSSP